MNNKFPPIFILLMSLLASLPISSFKSGADVKENDQQILNDNASLIKTMNEIRDYPYLIKAMHDIVAFAQEVNDSGFSVGVLAPRIKKRLKAGDPIFSALRTAIRKERFHVWKLNRNKKVLDDKHLFVSWVSQQKFSDRDKKKLINAYAICIDSYRNDIDREWLRPKVCERINEYKKPRHRRRNISVQEIPSSSSTLRVKSYRYLMEQAQQVAKEKKLTTFEKVAMAKCVAEQSLRFFLPAHHPIRAIGKLRDMKKKTPEDLFFMHSGMCGNFSALAYGVTLSLGLKGHMHLARKRFHIYLEFKEKGQWYHTHPFNSQTACDIIKF